METYIRSGTYAVKPTLPYTPGKDVAGVVEDVGAKVLHLQVRVSPERERKREREREREEREREKREREKRERV